MNRLRKIILSLMLCSCALAGIAQPCYDFSRLQRERLGRGIVAVRQDADRVAVSWRYLSADPMKTAFNLYRDTTKIATIPAGTGTFYTDTYRSEAATTYTVKPVVDGWEGEGAAYTLPANAPMGYIDIPLDRPADGVTPAGQPYTYSPNDASVGDVDGDGTYEIILKWDPSNAHDNSHDGYTGNVYLDCYRLTGEKLWRIDLGRNIRAGAHYTQFMVYDLDGDGRAEVVMRTADGTVDGTGRVIGDAKADYREPGHPGRARNGQYMPHYNQGRIFRGNEYLTVFEGLTGRALKTIDYVPPRGDLAGWGDTRANRSDRFLACVAHLDGMHPSVVMCRGYYTRTVLAAFDWDGKELTQRWLFDSNTPEWAGYAGQGNHNLRVADVDCDSCDEIVYGSCTIDHDGTGLYTTGLGHGDALHLTQFDPSIPELQVWACHERDGQGSTFRHAATGEIIFQIRAGEDVGRCMAADIDPTNRGVEMWSSASGGIRNIKGEVVAPRPHGLSCNMAVWWDGDLLRELLDRNRISKYDWKHNRCDVIASFDGCTSNNGTKATPCLQGDIVGDWREEVLLRTDDNRSLRLYVTTIPTPYRFHTFLEDPVYRLSIVTENVAYNQPTQPGFYFGPDGMKGCTFRGYAFDK